MSLLKKLFVTLSTIGALIIILLWFMANPKGTSFAIYHYGEVINAPILKSGDTLTILTFNMAYGYGVGSDGVNYEPKAKEFIYERLNSIALLIQDVKADLVLLQEVDFDADRSGNRNQAEYLSKKTGLPFSAEAISWNARYVPFPYWPIRHHFGKTVSGGAVLSRFPIVEHEATFLPKPESNPWYYNWFYLYRYVQNVSFETGSFAFRLLNMHLEAFDVPNKEKQAEFIKKQVESSAEMLFFGGDMNSLPPNAPQRHDFNDQYNDDYRNDSTQKIIRSISGFREPIQSENPAAYFTFPPLNPNRQLDYVFVRDSIQVLRYEVIQTGDLSDHLPILLQVRL